MTDPNYKRNLERFFKSKGFKYSDIEAWMERNKIDEKINEAKSNTYTNGFVQSLDNGDFANASLALSYLVGTDPKRATALMANFPSFKDNWSVNNARENAMVAYQMKQKADQAKYQQQLAREQRQFEEKMKLAAYNSGLKLEEYKQRLGFGYNTIAQMQGTEAANQWLINTLNRSGKGGKNSNANNNASELKGKAREWHNKLKAAREDAYSSMGDMENPGKTFEQSEEGKNDHNVENYRLLLEEFKRSAEADDKDIEWANEELAKLQNEYTNISRVVTALRGE